MGDSCDVVVLYMYVATNGHIAGVTATETTTKTHCLRLTVDEPGTILENRSIIMANWYMYSFIILMRLRLAHAIHV